MLRGVDLTLEPGERVALMGRNGAGKSTLLRLLKGLAEPTRGRIERAGEVALLLQNPGDYLIHEHAREEAGERGAGGRRAGRAAATPTRATSPAASASGWRSRWCWAAGRCAAGAARRAHARHGPRAQGRAGRADRASWPAAAPR